MAKLVAIYKKPADVEVFERRELLSVATAVFGAPKRMKMRTGASA